MDLNTCPKARVSPGSDCASAAGGVSHLSLEHILCCGSWTFSVCTRCEEFARVQWNPLGSKAQETHKIRAPPACIAGVGFAPDRAWRRCFCSPVQVAARPSTELEDLGKVTLLSGSDDISCAFFAGGSSALPEVEGSADPKSTCAGKDVSPAALCEWCSPCLQRSGSSRRPD